MAPLIPTTNCADQEVAMSFDWLPEVQDRYAIFQVRLRRGERHSWFNINLDLPRFGPTIETRSGTSAEYPGPAAERTLGRS
jgi:hypothetical protein